MLQLNDSWHTVLAHGLRPVPKWQIRRGCDLMRSKWCTNGAKERYRLKEQERRQWVNRVVTGSDCRGSATSCEAPTHASHVRRWLHMWDNSVLHHHASPIYSHVCICVTPTALFTSNSWCRVSLPPDRHISENRCILSKCAVMMLLKTAIQSIDRTYQKMFADYGRSHRVTTGAEEYLLADPCRAA